MLPVFWLLPLAAALAGPPPLVTTLRGHIDHAPATADSVRLIVGQRWLGVALSPTGDFRVVLPGLPEPLPTEFSYGDYTTHLYLTPGDQLTMRLDYQHFSKTLTYSGRGSVANNYLAQDRYQFSDGPPVPGRPSSNDFLKGTPAEARQQTLALRQARREFLATYGKAHPLPAAFVHEQQVAIDAQYATQQLLYAYKHDDAPMPPGYFDFLAETPTQELNRLHKRSFIDNSLLANMVLGYSARLLPPGRPEAATADDPTRHMLPRQLSTDPAEGPRLYALATRDLGEGRARDWVIETVIFSNLRDNLPGAQAFYRTFRLHNRDSLVARALREGFATAAKAKAQMQVGQPAPDFTLTDLSGQQVSLSQYKGKVVYLDFWGTWCGPCMRQLREFAPVLKEQFAGKNVVFLYVSVGDTEAKWQQTVAEQHFTSPNSVHLRAPDSQLATTYLVNGYPSYYLIGRDGRLLLLNAPWPSDGSKTVAAIEQALKQ